MMETRFYIEEKVQLADPVYLHKLIFQSQMVQDPEPLSIHIIHNYHHHIGIRQYLTRMNLRSVLPYLQSLHNHFSSSQQVR